MAYETIRYEVADRVATITLEPAGHAQRAVRTSCLDELIDAFEPRPARTTTSAASS